MRFGLGSLGYFMSALVPILAVENLDQFELRRFFFQIPVLGLIFNIYNARSTDFISLVAINCELRDQFTSPTMDGRVCFDTEPTVISKF